MDMNIAHNGSCLLFLRNARYIYAPDVTSRLTHCDAHCLDYLGAVRSSDTFNLSTSFRLLFIQIPIPQVLFSERILITLFIWIETPHGRVPGKTSKNILTELRNSSHNAFFSQDLLLSLSLP